MNIAIIGCGFIGQKRAKTIASCSAKLIICADQKIDRAQILAKQFSHCEATDDWHQAVAHPDVEVVLVSTIHCSLAEITLAAVTAGKHVLVEKPAACHAAELAPIIKIAKEKNVLVRVGFNHRYHRAFRQAKKIINEGVMGELMFLRARYGHGGRLGYDKEWRANPQLSGGGELIDQGMHLIDLARWFLGDFTETQGFSHTYYWDMPVDDNGFLLLKTAQQQVAFLHASCTEWKNLFSFEIYGRQGKLDVTGLGGSYGLERLAYYKMLPEMGPPETTIWEYPMADDSWDVEFAEFLEDIRLGRQPVASLHDAQAALQIVEDTYRISKL